MTGPALRLLVVDDTEANRDLLSRRLTRLGYDVVTAASGPEALTIIATHRIALLLLDVEMPVMSGLDVLTILRQRYSAIELPVIMVTARQTREDILEALTLGANDYITKPIDFPIALARIQTQVSLKQAEAALRESEERYALAARGANDGLWDWNLVSDAIYFSPRWKLMLGWDETDIGATPDEWFERVHPDEVDRVRAAVSRHLASEMPQFECEHRLRHRNGSYRWMLARGAAIRDEHQQATRFAGSLTDITEGKVSDALTGLPNRILFLERLGNAVQRRKRNDQHLYAVLFLDLDGFKVVNDSLGHMVGDQLLVAVGRRLQQSLRTTDTCARLTIEHMVARLGGDEFTILLEDVKHVDDTLRVAERIQETLGLPVIIDGHELFTSASIGIAIGHREYDDPESVLRDADTALYRAKALGKARFEMFDTEMRERAVARMRLETDLRKAVERGEFRLHYQPIVSLAPQGLTAVEALIRWQHSERGLVYPADFIPVAEETGLIVAMGWWALRAACSDGVRLLALRPDSPVTVAVNLSGRQFAEPNLVPMVERILAETGFPASLLKLEITESTIVENLDSIGNRLRQLREIGVRIAIDDFGTGYSSLSYLHRLPVDSLKIDRSFVSRLATDGFEIVKAIVVLAHTLGLKVIAEGVETDQQLQLLESLGCEFGQGYLFARPLDFDALATQLATPGAFAAAAA